MKRREFVAVLGSAAAWPLMTRAQNAGGARRVGMLVGISGDDPDAKLRYAAFSEELRKLGWTNGQNVQVEVRWAAGDAKLLRQYASELIALKPDVMVSVGSLSAETLLRSTSTVPIIFTVVLDPVGASFVKSLSRPGGNAAGFMQFEYTLSAKWPESLKQIAPTVTRAVVLRDAGSPPPRSANLLSSNRWRLRWA